MKNRLIGTSIVGIVGTAIVGIGAAILRPRPADAPSGHTEVHTPPENPTPAAHQKKTPADAFNAERARINIQAAEELERLLAADEQKSNAPGGK